MVVLTSNPGHIPYLSQHWPLSSRLSYSEDQMWSRSCRACGDYQPYFPSESEAIISITAAASPRHSYRSVLQSREAVKHSADPQACSVSSALNTHPQESLLFTSPLAQAKIWNASILFSISLTVMERPGLMNYIASAVSNPREQSCSSVWHHKQKSRDP